MTPSSSSNASNSSDKAYKGVGERKPGQWHAQIWIPDSTKPRILNYPNPLWLGYFDSKVKAARAYDLGMVCVYGSQPDVLRRLHFPNTPPVLSYPEDQMLTAAQVRDKARRHANGDGTVQPAQDTVPSNARDPEKERKSSGIGKDALVSPISARPSASNQFFDFMGVEKSAPEPNVVDPTSNQIEGASPAVDLFYDFMGVTESPPVQKEVNNNEKEDQDFNP
ncbi:hypothetical protein LUZ61_005036 [Rhynchospora tenuis]|uniref:AP2/ERF domain-containing protein n=1 Tax=Rhynchospora tenuis TaxID=198213 RepID=A0AAD5ZNY0_9POAL|nr:hypothetical protein LUZ61_005036 [Rhynchospora tenuis]